MSERERCGSVRRTVMARGPPNGTARGDKTWMGPPGASTVVTDPVQRCSMGVASTLLIAIGSLLPERAILASESLGRRARRQQHVRWLTGSARSLTDNMRGSAVYARSTTFQARPGSIDEGVAYVRDEVMPDHGHAGLYRAVNDL